MSTQSIAPQPHKSSVSGRTEYPSQFDPEGFGKGRMATLDVAVDQVGPESVLAELERRHEPLEAPKEEAQTRDPNTLPAPVTNLEAHRVRRAEVAEANRRLSQARIGVDESYENKRAAGF